MVGSAELRSAATMLGLTPTLELQELLLDKYKDLGGMARRVLGDDRPSNEILEELEDQLTAAEARRLVRCQQDGNLTDMSHRY